MTGAAQQGPRFRQAAHPLPIPTDPREWFTYHKGNLGAAVAHGTLCLERQVKKVSLGHSCLSVLPLAYLGYGFR